MIYRNAVKYILNSPDSSDVKPSHSRMQLLCNHLGSPQKNLKYLRLAGSNGKTVCSKLLISVLKEAEISVGCLNMPVRKDIKDNITINGSPLSMEKAAEYATKVAAAVQEINSEIKKHTEEDPEADTAEAFVPSASEIILLMALLAFKENRCAICIIESDHKKADPTKFLPSPFAAVICGTIPSGDKKEISRIRSYICRGINEIVSAPQNPEAHRIIADTCSSISCRRNIPSMSELSISRLSLKATDFIYKDDKYTIKLCGKFEVENAVVALETVIMLTRHGYKISHEAIKRGLSNITIPAKFETLSSNPFIIVDSTHAPIAIEKVCDSMLDFKALTGSRVRLCLPEGEIIQNYVKALTARGYDIENIITVSPNVEAYSTFIENIEIKAAKSFKQAAKESLRELKDSFLLVSGPYAFAGEMRYEVEAILKFN